jgi:hypothetical protein
MERTTLAICPTGTVSELDDTKIALPAVFVNETAQRISCQLALENIQFAIYLRPPIRTFPKPEGRVDRNPKLYR